MLENTTAQFDIIWHHRVHARLGERLYYYFVPIRSSIGDLDKIRKVFDELVNGEEVGSIRIFQIFGQVDFVVRVWLLESRAAQFKDKLVRAFPGGSALIKQFRADHIDMRWYDRRTAIDLEALERLELDTIRMASLDTTPEERQGAIQELRTNGLVLHRYPQPQATIIFFVGVIEIEQREEHFRALSNTIQNHLQTNRHLVETSVYRGSGDYSLLFKGEVKFFNYFAIADFVSWLSTQLSGGLARTETFLVGRNSPIVGIHRLGPATLRLLEGKSLRIFALLPEVYSHTDARQAEEVIAFLSESVLPRDLDPETKVFVPQYLKAYLAQDANQMRGNVWKLFLMFRRAISRALEECKALSSHTTAELELSDDVGLMNQLLKLVRYTSSGTAQHSGPDALLSRLQILDRDLLDTDILTDWRTIANTLLDTAQLISEAANTAARSLGRSVSSPWPFEHP